MKQRTLLPVQSSIIFYNSYFIYFVNILKKNYFVFDYIFIQEKKIDIHFYSTIPEKCTFYIHDILKNIQEENINIYIDYCGGAMINILGYDDNKPES